MCMPHDVLLTYFTFYAQARTLTREAIMATNITRHILRLLTNQAYFFTTIPRPARVGAMLPELKGNVLSSYMI
jgi:hypothetical protein